MNRRTISITGSVIALFILLGACEKPVEELNIVKLQPIEFETGLSGGSISMSVNEMFSCFPPSAVYASEAVILENMFLPLARKSFDSKLVGRLADKMVWNEEKTSLRLRIHPLARWSDGQSVVAEDFLFAVENFYFSGDYPDSYYNRLVPPDFRDSVVIEASSGNSVTITSLENPWVIELVATMPALPSHIFGPVFNTLGRDAMSDYWPLDSDLSEVVANGPFLPDKYELGEKLILKPNPEYFEKDSLGNQLPYLQKVTLYMSYEEKMTLERYILDQTDFQTFKEANFMTYRDELVGDLVEIFGETVGDDFLVFNQNEKLENRGPGIEAPRLTWFRDRNFLWAIRHLLNFDRFSNEAGSGYSLPQYSFVPRFSRYYWSGIEEYAPDFSVDQASEILTAGGYIDRDGDGIREDSEGNPLSFSIVTNAGHPVRASILEILVEDLKSAGLDARGDVLPFNQIFDQLMDSRDWDGVIIGISGRNMDPLSETDSYLYIEGDLRLFHFDQGNPLPWEIEMEELIQKTMSSKDENRKIDLYREVQKMWMDKAPWFFMIKSPVFLVRRKEIRNLYPTMEEDGEYYPLHRVFWD